ncbi:MAG TPA: tRNA (adenosine(37)-N6)-dimethylallyltransferase MiaA [Flavitalea sp.]|nr:tRNA (adenosine(37)-N6)-dimethylallyltransferase MiaA [Flavitalea sp.]
MKNKTVILITGPTASGKTSLALTTAQHYQTQIISADSRQCFIEMNIGVAKPSSAELALIKHYFINSHSIHDEVNAATFAQYATDAAQEIFNHHDVLVMAGGTGLYIKAFFEGLDDIPPVSAEIRETIVKQYEQHGLEWLQDQICLSDPDFFTKGEIKNPQRLMRALEVIRATGKSIREFHKNVNGKGASEKYKVIKYAIKITREELYENINNRVEIMMHDGLLEEVRLLIPYRRLNALQTVGYSELFEHLDGKLSLEEAVNKIKQNTRNYAKRQMTWFRKDKDIRWINAFSEIEL